jgi:hypothetical protein
MIPEEREIISSSRKKRVRLLFLLGFFLVTVVFGLSVQLRRPYFARPLSINHEWLTASTIKFATSWYQDGPWRLRFALLEFPGAIDKKTMEARKVYPSYPPGQIFPIYLLAVLRGQLPGPALVEAWNLFSHYITALVCFMLVFLMLDGFEPYMRCFFAVFAGSMQIFFVPALWLQQNVYGPDTAVIMPFALFVLMLYAALFRRMRWYGFLCLFAVTFYGSLVDWFFCLVAGMITLYCFVGLLRRRERRGRIFISVALGLVGALAFFIWQLRTLNGFEELSMHLKYRTSSAVVQDIMAGSTIRCLRGNFVYFYGRYFCWWAAVAVLFPAVFLLSSATRRFVPLLKRQYAFAWGALLLPCLVYTVLLPHHAAIHSFSVLKFTVPFAVFTALFFVWLRELLKKLPEGVLPFFCMVVLIAIACNGLLPQWLGDYKSIASRVFDDDIRKGLAIAFTLQPDEVGVSPDFELNANPPQALAYSRRAIYPVDDCTDVLRIADRTGCNRIRVYFYNRDGAQLWDLYEAFQLFSKPQPVSQFPEYSSALVDIERCREQTRSHQ